MNLRRLTQRLLDGSLKTWSGFSLGSVEAPVTAERRRLRGYTRRVASRRFHALLAAGLIAGALSQAAAAEARLYSSGCGVDRGEAATYSSTRDPADLVPWEVLGKDSTLPVAGRLRQAMLNKGIWEWLQAHFSAEPPPNRRPGAPASEPPRPYQIFVVPAAELGPSYPALTTEYCSAPTASVTVVRDDIQAVAGLGDISDYVLAHELFHAFQVGAAGHPVAEGWWIEATAEWGSFDLAPEDFVLTRDDDFLDQPEVPLDRFSSATRDALHGYGAFRFVQWLETKMGPAPLTRLLEATFRRSSSNQTRVLRDELRGAGRDLGDDLGRFWAEHLRPEPAINQPRVEGHGFAVGLGRRNRVFSARALAADIARLRVSGGVGRITIGTDGASEGGKLWVLNSGRLEDWSDGGEAGFCVSGRGGALPRWPGEFPLAFTDGRAGGSARVRLEFDADNDDCEPRPTLGGRSDNGWHIVRTRDFGVYHFRSVGTHCGSSKFGTWRWHGDAHLRGGTVNGDWTEQIIDDGADHPLHFSRIGGTYVRRIGGARAVALVLRELNRSRSRYIQTPDGTAVIRYRYPLATSNIPFRPERDCAVG